MNRLGPDIWGLVSCRRKNNLLYLRILISGNSDDILKVLRWLESVVLLVFHTLRSIGNNFNAVKCKIDNRHVSFIVPLSKHEPAVAILL